MQLMVARRDATALRLSFRMAGALLVCILFLLGLTGQMAQAQDDSEGVTSPVVISQVYGGGGNSGATYTHDFIELFNRGDAPVSLAGWSVQYASATGTSWQATPLTGTLLPGRYLLVQQAQGRGGSLPLPTADVTGTIHMSSRGGKIVLLRVAEALPRGVVCPAGVDVADIAGFGGADCFDGSGPGPGLDNSSAAQRADGGCAHSGDNSRDFAGGPPQPRNSASPRHPCPVAVSGPTGDLFSPEIVTGTVTSAPTITRTGPFRFPSIRPTATPRAPVRVVASAPLTVAEPITLTGRLLISQIYGGGGNRGATYTHDFIELYNPGPDPILLTGWSVQYASAQGATWLVTPLTGTIPAGSYFLIQQAEGAGGRLALPRIDALGETAMSASSGKVALVYGLDALSVSCPAGDQVVDLVGYGGANCYEGAGAAPRANNRRAVLRGGDPPVDRDDNRADFVLDAPEPR